MGVLDRTEAPGFKTIDSVEILQAEKTALDNGVPLYVINAGEQDLVKIDFVFNAGEWDQEHPLIANSTMLMLAEGTLNQTAEQIAEKLDFLGSFVYYSNTKHQSVITVYSLNKYIDDTLRVLKEVVKYPSFPRNEFMTLRNKQRQKFLIDQEKVEIISQRAFLKNLFGEKHPYGKSVEMTDYDRHETAGLRDFHEKFLNSKNCQIIVSGKKDHVHYESLNKFFGNNHWGAEAIINESPFEITGANEKFLHIEKEGAVQSSVRIGTHCIGKQHKDYPKLQLLNTVLGGYFGSRLMTEIREKQGYTYGIGSGIVAYKNASYFTIVSNVGNDVRGKAVDAIMNEVKLLRTEKIGEDELTVVKNHIMATMLRNFDGPFALADNFRSMLLHGLDYSWYNTFIAEIKSATSEELLLLADKYFHEEKLNVLTCG